MQPQSVIIHERLANWARQIRPRFRGWPIRWAETRSRGDLVRAAARSACPILVVDLADRPVRGLEDLDAALGAAPMALSLVLDPGSHPGLAIAALGLGATLLRPGVVVPPEVVGLLHRWLPLARQRAESDGWSVPIPSEPWARPDPIFPIEPETGR
jgi:hypothetical protein